MPELPEVEQYRYYLEKHSLHQIIKRVVVTDEGILKGFDTNLFISKIEGQQFNFVQRHGKFLFININQTSWVVMHFGMTGDLRFDEGKSSIGKHDRVIFYFRNGSYLAYISQRKFGRLQLISSIEDYLKLHRFGPDALLVSETDFINIIKLRKLPIKSALLNQSVIAGIGNLYADEALFQSHINPTLFPNDISAEKLVELYYKLSHILTLAIASHADFKDYPEDFFIHFRKIGGLCPKCNSKLVDMKIGQRTTIFCPFCQSI